MSKGISKSAVGVLGWLKKVAAGQERAKPAALESFPLQSGVQLEFDLGLLPTAHRVASAKTRRVDHQRSAVVFTSLSQGLPEELWPSEPVSEGVLQSMRPEAVHDTVAA
jgi:hypothetical protein